MSEPRVQYVGEQNPSLTDVITSNGVAQDISLASLKKFKMRAVGSSTAIVNGNASFVTDGVDGALRYDWTSGDVDPANVGANGGFFLGWWEITLGGKVQSKPEFLLWFKPHGANVGWLLELVEVRQSMELQEFADELDDQIVQLIPAVSERILAEVDRELVPQTNAATRTFELEGRAVSFAPYDLRTASAVVLDPNGTPQTLAANVDYKLKPLNDRYGVFTRLILSEFLTVESARRRFGIVEVRVTGDWGFPTASVGLQIAKDACINEIKARLRTQGTRDALIDSSMGGSQPSGGPGYGLAPSTRNLLRPLYRTAP